MEFRVGVGVRGRNRPLRGFATHREANTPSEASAEGSGVRVGEWSQESGNDVARAPRPCTTAGIAMLRKLQTQKLAIVSFLVKNPVHKNLSVRNSIEYQIIANWKKAVFF